MITEVTTGAAVLMLFAGIVYGIASHEIHKTASVTNADLRSAAAENPCMQIQIDKRLAYSPISIDYNHLDWMRNECKGVEDGQNQKNYKVGK